MRGARPGAAGSGALRSGRGVVVAEGREQLLDGDVEGMGKGVPGSDAAGSAAVFEVNEGAPGQAATAGEFVEGPAALTPQARQRHAQRSEVGVGRQDRHPTIRRCRTLPCQCRPLHYLPWTGVTFTVQESALPCVLPAPSAGDTDHRGTDRREDDLPMRLAGAHAAVRRIWTVELRPRTDGPMLVCPSCTAHASPLTASSARSAALAHLACHARADVLPAYLRSCQCRVQGCLWHPRRRGCAGPVLLALTRDRSGRTWRLADTCAACAAATSHTAVVPDTLVSSPPLPSTCPPPSVLAGPRAEPDERVRVRVREMLTYLGAALPQFTSPAARLLGLQCALRTDSRGNVRLPTGLLSGMRLRGHPELWQELAHAGWLEPPDVRSMPVQVRLLDATVLDQAPGRLARCRAAHWALRPTPLALPAAPPALRLTALVLAAHTSVDAEHRADMDVLARLCGHSPQQTGELLDRLVTTHILGAWHHNRDTDEAFWQLPQPRARVRPVVRHRSHPAPRP